MFLSKLLTGRRTRQSDTPAKRRPSRKLRLESLEGRVLLDAAPVFDSVLGIAASVSPWSTKVDAAGNTYMAGTLFQTSDFDPNQVRLDGSDILTRKGSTDAFIAKYAPDNSLLWARRMGGDFVSGSLYGVGNDPLDGGYSLAIDATGNAYVAGNFVGLADFGPFTLTSAGDGDTFVAKLDANGNFVWANRAGTAMSRDFADGVAVDASGNVLVTRTTSKVFSNGGYTVNGMEVEKYNPDNGASIWTKTISNNGVSAEGGVATDTAGNVYVSGRFTGRVDFNPDPKRTNYITGSYSFLKNAYVLKLTAAGNFGWVSPFIAKSAELSEAYVNILDIAVDSTGNTLVGGYYFGPIDFNPSAKVDFRLPSTSTSTESFVAKLSPTGSLAWATPLGGSLLQGIAVDATGVYAVGTDGVSHMFVSHFTNAGAADWALANGGTGSAMAFSIDVDGNGTAYVAGTYSAYNGKVVDFDPDPVGTRELTTPTSASQIFLLKLRKQSAAALNDAALASLTLADTQLSKPSGKKASVFDSEMDWLAVSQV